LLSIDIIQCWHAQRSLRRAGRVAGLVGIG
jgi:hypothetical protein